jgi:hypothetical protein
MKLSRNHERAAKVVILFDKQKFLQKNEQYPLSLVFVSEEPNVQVIRVGEGSSRSGTHPS